MSCEHAVVSDGACLICGEAMVKRQFGEGWPWWKNLLLVAVAFLVLFVLLMLLVAFFPGAFKGGSGA